MIDITIVQSIFVKLSLTNSVTTLKFLLCGLGAKKLDVIINRRLLLQVFDINNDIKQEEYISETSRHLIKWLNEHINAIKKNNINSSAIAANYSNFHLGVKIDDRTFSVNLLHKCIGFMDRKILEACYIINYKPTLNKNTGLY